MLARIETSFVRLDNILSLRTLNPIFIKIILKSFVTLNVPFQFQLTRQHKKAQRRRMTGIVEKIKSSILIHLCFAISYFTSGLVINILQCLLFIFVKPFDKKLFRTLIYYLCYSFHCQLVAIAEVKLE